MKGLPPPALPDTDQTIVAGVADEEDLAPASGLEDEALLRKFKRWYQENIDAVEEFREGAREDFGFIAGHQWDEQSLAILREQQRPPVTFNRIGPIMDVVCGLEVNNREEITCKPREMTDTQAAELGTITIEWLRDSCDVEDEESHAFHDCAACGLGVLELRVDNEGEMVPRVERVDMMEVGWDTSAKRRNYLDRRFDWRARQIDLDEARAMFPDFEDEDLDAEWADDSRALKDSGGRDYEDRDLTRQERRGSVTIMDWQWYERKTVMRIRDPNNGEEMDFEPEKAAQLAERSLALGIQINMRRVEKKVWHQAFVGNKVLTPPELRELPVQPGGGTRHLMTGKMDQKTGMPYGIVRNAKDPQRWANKWLSQTMHIMNTSAKSGVMAEEGSITDLAEFEEQIAKPGAVVEVESGAISGGRIQRLDPPPYPQGFAMLGQQANDAIPQVTGINLEMLGLQDREQAGVETQQRKQSAITTLAPYFAGLRTVRKDAAKAQLMYAFEFTPADVLTRAVGEQHSQTLQQMRGSDWLPFDLILDEAPSSPNAKERAWAFMQPMLSILAGMNLPPAVWMEILKWSPMPTQFVEGIAKIVLQPPDPQAQQDQQIDKELLRALQKAEIDYKAAKTYAERADVAIDATKAAVNTASLMKFDNPGM